MLNSRNLFVMITFSIFFRTIYMNVIENDNINTKKFNNNNNNFKNMNNSDEYMINNQKECILSRKIISCIKFKTSKFLWSFATNNYNYFQHENTKSVNNHDGVKFIQLMEPSKLELFTEARNMENDNEFTKAWKFIKRATQTFLQRHAIQIPLTNAWGAKIDGLERTFADFSLDARGDKKKRKWLIILPLIILMKIAHLKMTVVPLLLGIAGLQLLTIIGGAYVIHYLKHNTLCKIHPHLIHTHSHVWDSEPEYSSFVGSYHGPSEEHSAGYSSDWGTSKAYRGYNYLDTISRPV